MDRGDFLEGFLSVLESLGVDFCVIGGVAVNAYSEPIVTEDFDVAIAIGDLPRAAQHPRPHQFVGDRQELPVLHRTKTTGTSASSPPACRCPAPSCSTPLPTAASSPRASSRSTPCSPQPSPWPPRRRTPPASSRGPLPAASSR